VAAAHQESESDEHQEHREDLPHGVSPSLRGAIASASFCPTSEASAS
jgi:hypothetical protein